MKPNSRADSKKKQEEDMRRYAEQYYALIKRNHLRNTIRAILKSVDKS